MKETFVLILEDRVGQAWNPTHPLVIIKVCDRVLIILWLYTTTINFFDYISTILR